jgi:hypothetical protein
VNCFCAMVVVVFNGLSNAQPVMAAQSTFLKVLVFIITKVFVIGLFSVVALSALVAAETVSAVVTTVTSSAVTPTLARSSAVVSAVSTPVVATAVSSTLAVAEASIPAVAEASTPLVVIITTAAERLAVGTREVVLVALKLMEGKAADVALLVLCLLVEELLKLAVLLESVLLRRSQSEEW